jgi:hypothetical protein
MQMLRRHGARYFSKVAIWDKDSNSVAAQSGVAGPDLSDPRSTFEKCVHWLLARTQTRRSHLWVRAFERYLRAVGWCATLLIC